MAERVIELFTKYIRNAMKDKDVKPAQVIKQVEQIGCRLRDCDRLNFIVPNTTKRCLHILRQACKQCKFDAVEQSDATDVNNTKGSHQKVL